MTSDIGLIGLAVMGENLALNMERHGFTVSIYNRTTSRTHEFISDRGKDKHFIPCDTLSSFCQSLKSPRKVFIMVKAGPAVDQVVDQLIPYLSSGDIIIDGGNSHFSDTERRVTRLSSEKGLLFVGCGVSGGEEGALNGPSLMPGGSVAAWPHIKPILQAIAAEVPGSTCGEKCCEWVGAGGAGHFVKMVHNGIEYGDMQLISETYHILSTLGGVSNQKLADCFEHCGKGDLGSYLIDITTAILKHKDDLKPDTNDSLVDSILDAAEQKGTGKWTGQEALERGVPVTAIAEAVFARCVSSLKSQRMIASGILTGPKIEKLDDIKISELTECVRDALYASKVVSYAQGFALMRSAGEQNNWNLNYGPIAMTWRNGCIIRSVFLGDIHRAFADNPKLENLMLAPFFAQKLNACQQKWRTAVSKAVVAGIPVPAMSSSLAYYDAYRCPRLPANLLQAQRDYFGAHTYERIDKPRGQYFHTNWTGHGGTTTSTPPSH